MEVIELPGYILEEKKAIAKQYLIPKQIEENGISEEKIDLTDGALQTIIMQYTREAGLRNLEREIGNVCRKVARKVAEGREKKMVIKSDNVNKYLGVPRFLPEEEIEEDETGVSTGLAWTPSGGEILRVEASITKGRSKLELTGQLGDVMRESAQASLSYAKRRLGEFNMPQDFFDKREVHIHVPAGAIPKDGPSAGITMATALVSAMARTPVRKDVAMTGEITLRGRVLPIGGIKEKALAALRNKIHTLIIPERNKKDLDDIPPALRKKITFVYAKNMDDVLETALVGGPPWARKKKTTSKTTATKSKKTSKKTSKKAAGSKKKTTAKKKTAAGKGAKTGAARSNSTRKKSSKKTK
jgi:ATP-dependent Lon protease